jgi:NAD(P)-dependent dehydrogenase (short-subunit alcohol dehydrogenase family)
MDLSGKVVVVPVDSTVAPGLAARLAAAGATVVLVGPDGEVAARLAATLEGAGAGRAAVFVTDGSAEGLDAVAAFVAELFRPPGPADPPRLMG